ncbi:MAG: M14 family metallocarboxypeptidase [Defluviitaleaceae bacterium]|nr:M14 family metallocarboxypeptidase [Defluviitaleaceae bacterium]
MRFKESVIGVSVQGRPIRAITVGHGPIAVMYNAAHHANEWITTDILLRFAEECVESYKPWYERVTLHMVPLVNPDGVEMVKRGGHRHWKANASGVDLNSNYPAGWELAKAHKFARGYTKPGPRDYVGPYPLSEPESRAMAQYTRLVKPMVTLSLHTQGEEIYWRYRDHMPPGAEELAKRLAKASGYLLEDVPSESSHGGYRDWFIEEFNRPGYTIECGLGESPLPFSDFDGIYEKVCPLMKEALGLV